MAVMMASLIVGSFIFQILIHFRVPFVEKAKPQVIRRFCQLVLKLISVRIDAVGAPASWSRRGAVIVANHVSYVDAVVLNACFTARFVTSEEIRASGLLGWLTKAAGCVFVERRNKMRLRQDLSALTEAIADGERVMFFPEGTTGPGLPMLPMKSSLVEIARRTGATVYVFALSYPLIGDRPAPGIATDEIAWYGDMGFFPHLWNLLKIKSTVCRLQFAGEIKPFSTGNRKTITTEIAQMIQNQLQTPAM
jgi:1-acyl-sn-glycerol-3-phosphate acyltransferase